MLESLTVPSDSDEEMSGMAATMDGVLKDFLQTTSSRLPFTSPIEKRLLSWKKVGITEIS